MTTPVKNLIHLLVLSFILVSTGCGDGKRSDAPHGRTLSETFAVNTHYAAGKMMDRAALARLRAAGVRVLRNDITWSAIEKQKGVYDFETTLVDELVEAAAAEGLELLFILDFGNRLHGPASAVVDDSGRAAFAAFAAAAAQRYRGRRVSWEVWNEPNLGFFWYGSGARPNAELYAELVKATAPAIRAVDPGATVVVGSVYTGFPELVPMVGGIPGIEFLQRTFAAGALEVADAVTFHPYRAEAPETVGETIDTLQRIMAAAGRTVPLWCGEWGYPTYDPTAPATGINSLPAASLDRQASYAVRMLLNNYRLGLPLTVWYMDRDAPHPDPGNMEDNFGLMNDDLSPKPSYTALATVNRLVGDGTLAGELPLGEGRYGLEFDTPRGKITALWAVEPIRWTFHYEKAGARVIGRDGDLLDSGAAGSTQVLTVQPDLGPVYLEGGVTLVSAHAA